MTEEQLQPIRSMVRDVGGRTKAIALIEMTHDGQVSCWTGGAINDIIICNFTLENFIRRVHDNVNPLRPMEKPSPLKPV